MKNKSEKLGILYIIISAVLFGFMPFLAKVAYQHGSNVYSVVFGRFFMGALFLFAIVLLIPNCTIKVTKLQLMELVKLSVFYALVPVLLYGSYDYIDSGLATTLHFTYPVVVVIILALFCKEKLDSKQIGCTLISIFGIAFLYTPGGKTSTQGIVLAVLSGVAYAGYIVLLGKSRISQLHLFTVSFWIAFLSAIEIGAIGLFTKNIHFDMDIIAWAAEIVLALLSTVIGLVLFQKGVSLCGEIKASLLSAFEPVTGIVVGILVFHEIISWKELLGIVCIIIAAIILVVPFKWKKGKKDETNFIGRR